MQDRMKLGEAMTVGGQPSEEDFEDLRRDGFRTIVNLRLPDEEKGQLSPDKEGEKVRALGMEYLHLPVSGEALAPEQVDRFRQAMRRMPAPVFVHCSKGKRAGAFAMMDLATAAGWTGEEAIRKAEEMGFECDQPELEGFVRDYINRNRRPEPGERQAA